MATVTDTQPTTVTSELRYTMGLVCKDSFTMREIDALFIYNGADEEWWMEPRRPQSSSRVNRVNGWFEGIKQRAPEREAEVLRQVCGKLLTGYLDPCHRQAVSTELAKPDGAPAPLPPSWTATTSTRR